jgi:hypothetical protein
MSWNDVDDKHKKRFDRIFVSCEENYEKNFIIDSIVEEFPWYTRARVEAAVGHCCRIIPAPRPRKAFWECVANQLK